MATRRFTIALDESLVVEAMAALGQPTMRATVEEALRRATQAELSNHSERREKQIETLQRAARLVDEEVLLSSQAWHRG